MDPLEKLELVRSFFDLDELLVSLRRGRAQLETPMRQILDTADALVTSTGPNAPNLPSIARTRARFERWPALAKANVDELATLMSEALLEVFTEEELQALATFYSTPVGRSVRAKLPRAGEAQARASVRFAEFLEARLDEEFGKR